MYVFSDMIDNQSILKWYTTCPSLCFLISVQKKLPFPLGYFKYDAPTTTSLRTPTGLIRFPVNEPKTDAIVKGTVAFSITIPKPPKQNLRLTYFESMIFLDNKQSIKNFHN